jgi:PilZ domain
MSLELFDSEPAVQTSRLARRLGPEHAAVVTGSERRAHPRLSARELRWLNAARLKYGPPVRLIDLSVGGALLESDVSLRPGSTLALELVGAGPSGSSPVVVPLRVVRCQLTSLGDKPVYRAACAFRQPMDLPDLVLQSAAMTATPAPDRAPTTIAVSSAAATDGGAPPASAASTPPAAAASTPASSANSPEPRTTSAGEKSTRWTMIILRYLDGSLLKGYCNDFSSSRSQINLWPSVKAAPSERMIVPLSRLKAVFFVREFGGNPGYVDRQEFEGAAHGRKMEITFLDGEVVLGSTLTYRPEGPGFFLHPADARSNNTRIFVVSDSVRHARFI